MHGKAEDCGGGNDWWVTTRFEGENVRTGLYNDYRRSLGSELAQKRIIYGFVVMGAIGFSIRSSQVFDPPAPLFMACAWLETFGAIRMRSYGALVFEDGTVLFRDGTYFKDDAHWKGISFLKEVRFLRLRGGWRQDPQPKSS